MKRLLGSASFLVACATARADFTRGHLYFSTYQFEDCQRPDQIWEFDPASKVFAPFGSIPESCSYPNQIAITPSGNLRVGLEARSELIEFSGDGTYQTLLGPADGLVGVVGVAYDRFDSFYLSDFARGTVQYPFYGGPPLTWTSAAGMVVPTQAGFYSALPAHSTSLLYTPAPGTSFPFDQYSREIYSFTVSAAGDVFVLTGSALYAYKQNNPSTRRLLSDDDGLLDNRYGIAMALTPDGRTLYVNATGRLYAVDTVSGSTELVGGPPSGATGGIGGMVYYVPEPASVWLCCMLFAVRPCSRIRHAARSCDQSRN